MKIVLNGNYHQINGSDYMNFNDNGLCELVGMIDLMRNHILGDRFGKDSDN